ncbi:unnamed protein product [Rangifer tarandus platyrhynchus]|uniref:Uncharacterized protein n=1 Tax=Rangifer tarandus platyrhynchus TaxID=3082113 RepID=A0AC59ZLY7_RANTA
MVPKPDSSAVPSEVSLEIGTVSPSGFVDAGQRGSCLLLRILEDLSAVRTARNTGPEDSDLLCYWVAS